MNLYALPIGERAPEIINIVVEIPKGTCNKVEYDPGLEIFRLDRVLHYQFTTLVTMASFLEHYPRIRYWQFQKMTLGFLKCVICRIFPSIF